jgi:hypothetical protein
MAHANDHIANVDSVERKTIEHWPSIRSGRYQTARNEDQLTDRAYARHSTLMPQRLGRASYAPSAR